MESLDKELAKLKIDIASERRELKVLQDQENEIIAQREEVLLVWSQLQEKELEFRLEKELFDRKKENLLKEREKLNTEKEDIDQRFERRTKKV